METARDPSTALQAFTAHPLAPQDDACSEELVHWCVSLLLDVARNPGNHGPQGAALALGILSYLDDPESIEVPPEQRVNRGLLAMAASMLLAPDQVRSLGRAGLFQGALQSAGPLIRDRQRELKEGGKRYVLKLVLERAALGTVNARDELDHYLVTTAPSQAFGEPMSSDRFESEGSSLVCQGRFMIHGEHALLSRWGRKVYRGTDMQERSPVLLVQIEGPWIYDAAWRSRLIDWGRALCTIDDDRFIRLRGIQAKDQVVHIAYDAYEGRTLAQDVARGAMREDDALRKIERIAQALRHVHERGLVFQRLRPDRIFFDANDEVKLFDIPPPPPRGRIEDEDTVVEKGLLGESRYMAPEVCGGSEEPGPAADVYSLGMLLCEMLLGEQNLALVAGGPMNFWYRWHLDRSTMAVPLCEIDASISSQLSAVVSRMLDKQSCHRYQSVDEFLRDLAGLQHGEEPVVAPRVKARMLVNQVVRDVTEGAPAGGAGAAGRSRFMGWLAGAGGALALVVALFLAPGSTQGPADAMTVEDAATVAMRRQLEEALTHLRDEQYDKAQVLLDTLEKKAKPGPVKTAVTKAAGDLLKARGLSADVVRQLEAAKREEGHGQAKEALAAYQEAARAHRQLSALIERPDRPLPADVDQGIQRLAPHLLLAEARDLMKISAFERARSSVRLCMNNHPGTKPFADAEALDRVLDEIDLKIRQFKEAVQAGSRFERSLVEEAMIEYTKARQLHEELGRLSGGPWGAVELQDLKEKMSRTATGLWRIELPRDGERVVAKSAVVEIAVPSRFFTGVRVEGRDYPIEGSRVVVELKDLVEGPVVLPVVVTSTDGVALTKMVRFHYSKPVLPVPRVTLSSTASDDAGNYILAIIEYQNEDHRVEVGWVSPDKAFKVKSMSGNEIVLELADGRIHSVTY